MKVAHVVRQYLPSIGGMEEVVRSLARYQQTETRYQPVVITLDRVFREPDLSLPPMETVDGIPVHRLSYRGSERYPLCPQVLRALGDTDLVHVHGIDFFFDYLAWTRLLHGKRLIASTHGGFFHTKFAARAKRLYFNSMTRASAKAYRRIVATSGNDGRIFSEVVDDRRLKTIENGVDVEKFAGAATGPLQPELIYFGRWSVNKGLLETLDVLAALCAQQPETPWRLTVAGREYDLDAVAIAAHATRLGIINRVKIHPGPSNAELKALIAQASYFVCLSHHEGFGIAPIEAMSAGLLPILSSIPPFRYLVESTRVGLILDGTNASQKANQIAQFHALQASLMNNGLDRRQAARHAAAPYSWKTVAASYVQQYDQVMEEQ